MTDHATNNVWVSRTGTHGKAIEDRLRALQNRHRLAIHMVEHDGALFQFNPTTLGEFEKIDPADIDGQLRAHTAPLNSFTLIPSVESGATIRPYGVHKDHTHNYGYLFDFSQTGQSPARVVRAHHSTLNSQFSSDNKFLRLRLPPLPSPVKRYLPELKAFYERFKAPTEGEWSNNVKEAIGGPDGASLTEEQLDLLGKAYEKIPAALPGNIKHRILDYNEVVACAGKSHIAAIAIADYRGNDTVDYRLHAECLKLQAALVGLDHLDEGKDWPVVIYHVDGPRHGAIDHVGRGREELTQIAYEALAHMGEAGIRRMGNLQYLDINNPDKASLPYLVGQSKVLQMLDNSLRRHLGIDVGTPSEGPDGWVAKAHAAGEVMRVAPAPAR